MSFFPHVWPQKAAMSAPGSLFARQAFTVVRQRSVFYMPAAPTLFGALRESRHFGSKSCTFWGPKLHFCCAVGVLAFSRIRESCTFAAQPVFWPLADFDTFRHFHILNHPEHPARPGAPTKQPKMAHLAPKQPKTAPKWPKMAQNGPFRRKTP